jgi:hypothetical protein
MSDSGRLPRQLSRGALVLSVESGRANPSYSLARWLVFRSPGIGSGRNAGNSPQAQSGPDDCLAFRKIGESILPMHP